MRLNITFITLLAIATVTFGLEVREVPLARDGDQSARVIVFASAPVLAAAVALLARIVTRVDSARRESGVSRR